MKRFLCILIGHQWSHPAMRHGILECDRCKLYDPPGTRLPFSIPSWVSFQRWKIRYELRRLRNWIRPCSECGRRFGKHDNNEHDLPF